MELEVLARLAHEKLAADVLELEKIVRKSHVSTLR